VCEESEEVRRDPRGIDVIRALLRIPAMEDVVVRLSWLEEMRGAKSYDPSRL